MAVTSEFDPELPVIDAVRAGDRNAFGELVRRHDRWVRGVIYGVMGERDRVDDVAQQVWSAAWMRLGELRDTARWRPWLYRLARNAAYDAGRDIARRRARFRSSAAEKAGEFARSAGVDRSTPDGAIEQDERNGGVLKAIEGLPAIYREPFVLRHLNDWSYQQIADAMGMPIATVETRLVRARRCLREALKHAMV